jgi:hypothetical protein
MKFYFDKKTECIFCEPNTADEWLKQIWLIGCDYDGCHTSTDLMKLVDELLNYADKARECLRDGKIFPVDEESMRSHAQAITARNLYLEKKGDT